ncbi:MCE family protein [Nocardioides sp. NPDC059952]|uniref:MCE family protein n=1 Tax=Nocardioides sp. NPDC059952 TaxID=3347014 RepID=UPI0036585343
MRTFRIWMALVVAILLVAAGATVLDLHERERRLTVMFSRTTSLYEGAAVKVLGVKVGRVTRIEVDGTEVAVTMTYDRDVLLPKDVHAMIVPPSLVGDRFVQLAPAYLDGPVLPDDSRLGVERSGVPLELDDTFEGLDELAVGLGPDGANRDGALSDLLASSAEALDGNGELYRETVTELAAALDTLATSSDDASATVTNLDTTTKTLAGSDEEIRAVVTALATIGVQLNGQRGDIKAAVVQLRLAPRALADFVHGNRGNLDRTIADLTAVVDQVDDHSAEVGEVLSLTPAGLSNLIESFVPINSKIEDVTKLDPAARAGSLVLRANLLDSLDVTLATVFDTICAEFPADLKVQLAGICGALRSAGGDIGKVLDMLVHASPDGILQLSGARTTTLPGLLTGGVE